MKKIILSTLAFVAVSLMSSCNDKLDIEQKGVTTYESFYQTDADAESALNAAYARFTTYVTGRGNAYIYTPIRAALNMSCDDTFAAGSNFGDNDFMAQLNEYRYDSGNEVVNNLYSGLFLANYACNLVIDNFKEGSAAKAGDTRTPTDTSKRCVAEARVLRATIYFYLAALWDTPPFVDHVIGSTEYPYNCDAMPENPKSHTDLMKWVASECESASADLKSRKDKTDKDGAVKVTKEYAYALAGKANLFVGDYTSAKTNLKMVIDSGKYALVPGDKYWENFHIEGDANEEKVFETNIEFNTGISSFGGINQRSSWMESQLWGWRADHFQAVPYYVYNGNTEGWGGLGVPQWFGDEFFANDGHSYRFDATLIHIDDVVYKMKYQSADLNNLTLEQKIASKDIGIKDPENGLYGQSFWLPYKQLKTASDHGSYGSNVRLNNFTVMRYAEVLLLYAEACIQSNEQKEALDAVNQIRERAGISKLESVTMDIIKKEKSYELWLEGCRSLDILRWGDTQRISQAGSDVPKLFDKLHRTPQPGDKNVTWEHKSEDISRFYTVSSTEAKDRGAQVGFVAGKHDKFPFPIAVIEKNPNIRQNPGY